MHFDTVTEPPATVAVAAAATTMQLGANEEVNRIWNVYYVRACN